MELTPNEIVFIMAICRYFHENGDWPTLRWLERELLNHKGFDRNVDVQDLETWLMREMYDMYIPHNIFEPDRQVQLTVYMLGICYRMQIIIGLKEELDAFFEIMRFCVYKYHNDIEPFSITEAEAIYTLDMSEDMARKVFLLAKSDVNIHGGSGYNSDDNGRITNWHIDISNNIRVYRNVQKIEDYLDVLNKLKPKRKPASSGGPTNPGRGYNYRQTLSALFRDMGITPGNSAEIPPISTHANAAIKDEKLPENSLLVGSRTKIFISYSHNNKSHLERLQIHLEPYRRAGIDLWDDTRIAVGQQWQHEIERALAATKVAILLVSADFLASKFITENELPPLLAAAKTEGAVIIPVVVGACNFSKSVLSQFQAANNPSKPLANMPPPKREEVWSHVANVASQALAGPL